MKKKSSVSIAEIAKDARAEGYAAGQREANANLKAIIGMERDMAKAEERARIKEWANNAEQNTIYDTTYGDTDYDNEAVVYGWNEAMAHVRQHLTPNPKEK